MSKLIAKVKEELERLRYELDLHSFLMKTSQWMWNGLAGDLSTMEG